MKPLNSLWEPNGKYTKIFDLYIKGLTHQAIANEMGIKDRKYVTVIINKPGFQERLKKIHEGAKEKILNVFAAHGIKAARKIANLAEAGTAKERLQFEASKEILYQMGIKPIETIRETISREYTPDEIDRALSTMNEIQSIADRMGKTPSKFLIEKKAKAATNDKDAELDAQSFTPSQD